MTRTSINLQYPVSDATDTIQVLKPTATTVVQADGIEISKAFACKDNTLTIVIANTAESAKNVIFKKGDYPNSILGDLTYQLSASSTNLIKIENPSRLEKANGSLLIDFESGFTGTIYATGKHAGLKSIS